MKVSVVFFDLDSTLIQANFDELWAAAWLRLWQSHQDHLDVSLEAFSAEASQVQFDFFGKCYEGQMPYEEYGRGVVSSIFARYGVVLSPEESGEGWRAVEDAFMGSVKRFSDVVPCLDELKGQKLAVLTNGIPEWQKLKVGAIGLVSRFSVVVTARETGANKPNPDAFLRACELVGTHPDQCVNVGDNPENDVLAAQAVGMKAIWLNREGGMRPAESIVEISSLRQLPLVLSRLS